MPIAALPRILAIGSGGVIGLILGLVGGGGSILAVPLLVYVVGVPSAHVAIGTAAIAVALNAGFSLAAHARLGHREVALCARLRGCRYAWARCLEPRSEKPSTDNGCWPCSAS